MSDTPAAAPDEDGTTIGPKNATDDERIDEAMADTFPASDPPAHTGTTGPGGDVKPEDS